MHNLDDVQLYDLSEAGRLLYRDPVRLAREARHRRIPSAHIPHGAKAGGLGLPVPWVDAAAGTRPEDPRALCEAWLARLAPPSPDAHRAAKSTDALPAGTRLGADEAAKRLFASPLALQRLDESGAVPSLRIDGMRHYDERLIDLLAREADGEAIDPVEVDTRRFEIRAHARFEYRSAAEPAAPPPSEETPAKPARLIRVEGFETVDDDE